MRYTLRQLQVFLAITHYQNVTKAADALAMSQSACSGALKDFESQYSVKLFDRVGKRLQINDLGRQLRPMAEALMAQADNFEQLLKDQKHAGEIKVGATLTVGNYLAVGLIHRFMSERNSAKATLTVNNTKTIIERLLNFDIDVGLVEGEINHPDLNVMPWQKDELVCFSHPSHPLAQGNTITDDHLLKAQWILREEGSGTRQTFNRAMTGLIPNLDIKLELQHTEAIIKAVETGIGISCLSKIVLEDAFIQNKLVPLRLPDKDFSRWFYVVLHKEKFISENIKYWLSLCSQTIESI